ncbi:MAG: sensor histidine kinase [Gammaproteobacteria bacterium]|nr:sensor histidine kinase [Gammaproteobacteria bacterium]
MKRVKARPPPVDSSVIPEFCRAQPLVTLLFLMEALAVVLTLASGRSGVQAELRLLLLSVYLLWMGLCAAAILCLARRVLRIASVRAVFLACWALLVLMTWGVAELGWLVLQRFDFVLPPIATRASFVVRQVAAGAIVSLLLLRYFWQRHQWAAQTRAESEARYLALQARIRPHFLFNALNSVAELIRRQPDVAERMVEDLSDLFRASLDSHGRLVPLAAEIETARDYLRIEQVRLGDRLTVDWSVPEELMQIPLPRLTLQPLVENAVVHGISRLRAGGTVRIAAGRDGGCLQIEIENPLPPDQGSQHEGTGVAVNNIAQRIKLIYGDKAGLRLGSGRNGLGPLFRAQLRVPLQPVKGDSV